jgi:AraC-like DNA-binding protein
MNPHSKIIPFHLNPLGFIEAFTAYGANEAALFKAAGIDSSILRRGNAKISYAQQNALIRAGIELCRQSGIGLLVGMNFDWIYYGTVGGVVTCSPTLREAGDAFTRYLMISQPFYAMYGRSPSGYLDENERFIYQLRSFPHGAQPEAVTLFEAEFRLATVLRVWDAAGNKSVADPAVHVQLAYSEPTHAALYKQLPCASVQFNCVATTLSAHRDFFTAPFREYRRSAYEQLIARCEQELNDAHLEPTLTAKVRWHVYAQFNRQIALEQVADILRTTPRSLTRKLSQEGTTFRDIVHDVRMEITAHHLQSSNLKIDDVAELMGFSSASSLRRAIRNWSGQAAGAMQNGMRKPAKNSRQRSRIRHHAKVLVPQLPESHEIRR